jgi:hypothetical protein
MALRPVAGGAVALRPEVLGGEAAPRRAAERLRPRRRVAAAVGAHGGRRAHVCARSSPAYPSMGGSE